MKIVKKSLCFQFQSFFKTNVQGKYIVKKSDEVFFLTIKRIKKHVSEILHNHNFRSIIFIIIIFILVIIFYELIEGFFGKIEESNIKQEIELNKLKEESQNEEQNLINEYEKAETELKLFIKKEKEEKQRYLNNYHQGELKNTESIIIEQNIKMCDYLISSYKHDIKQKEKEIERQESELENIKNTIKEEQPTQKASS